MRYLRKFISLLLMFVLVAGSVNLTAKPVEAVTLDSTSKQVWDFLRSKGFSEYATAGIMGNIWAESGMKSTNLENYYEWSLGYNDDSYTRAVDNYIKGIKPTAGISVYKNFVHDWAGYGLCQWTYWSRKQGLFNMAKQRGRSIGDIKLQLDYLYFELTNHYRGVVSKLKSARSIKEASNAILLDFERPANQGVAVQNLRASYGEAYYKKYSKSKPVTGPNIPMRRVYGGNRYGTAFALAETYMLETNQLKLDNILVACGSKFPDALTATYFAGKKKAPIILWSEYENKRVQNFIKKNVNKGGTIYLLGGTAAVGDEIMNGLKGYDFERIYGHTRFDTNLQLTDAAVLTKGEILVCDGRDDGNGINALIAASLGRPLLLVDKGGLKKEQKAWLEKNESKITKLVIIGGTDSVDSAVESQLKAYGNPVRRIKGNNGDEVSAAVAKSYFTNPKVINISTMNNFPDALCGGPLTIASKGPILLVSDTVNGSCETYTKALTGIKSVNVFGGKLAVRDDTVELLAKNSIGAWTEVVR